ncbi:MAG: hypothetical protein QG597_3981 [Actinomycetota bacterium]|nr:hypothetical protein [Actinomycetota bacterium]
MAYGWVQRRDDHVASRDWATLPPAVRSERLQTYITVVTDAAEDSWAEAWFSRCCHAFRS